MKVLLLSSLFLTTGAFAQSLDISGLKAVMTANKAVSEKVNPGMTKLVTSTATAEDCKTTTVATQTILKIEKTKLIVISKEASTSVDGCADPFSETVVFFQDLPTLENDLADLDASGASNIMKAGNFVTMNVTATQTDDEDETSTQAVTVKYDFSLPSFMSLISTTAEDFSIQTVKLPDVDVNTFDLTNVLFCDSGSMDHGACNKGDYSDILF